VLPWAGWNQTVVSRDSLHVLYWFVTICKNYQTNVVLSCQGIQISRCGAAKSLTALCDHDRVSRIPCSNAQVYDPGVAYQRKQPAAARLPAYLVKQHELRYVKPKTAVVVHASSTGRLLTGARPSNIAASVTIPYTCRTLRGMKPGRGACSNTLAATPTQR
jgi:hypothetical protein